jgi:prophage regulatory protein
MADKTEIDALADLRDDQFVKRKAVEQLTSLSRATLYRKIRKGTFPRGEPIADNRVGWRVKVLRDWLSDPRGWTSKLT